jgi:hypothetical protein
MIGGEDHDRRLGPRVPGRHERRDGGVRGRDFAAVEIRPAEGGGRIVGSVGIEQVHPDEHAARVDAEPGPRRLGHGVPAPLRELVAHARRLPHRVVVRVEPAREPEAPGQREAAEERARGQAARPQRLRERRCPRTEREGAVAAHAMCGGQEAGQDRRVRGERDRGRGVGALEPHPARASASMAGVARPRRRSCRAGPHATCPRSRAGPRSDAAEPVGTELRAHPKAARNPRKRADRTGPLS